MNISSGADFNKLVGFDAGFLTSLNLGVGKNVSYLSTICPQIQPNPSLLFTCSHISNMLATPSTIMHNVTPLVAFGNLFADNPYNLVFSNMSETTNTIKFQFTTSKHQQIRIMDSNILITMVLRQTPLTD